jgi:uncharacterized protein (TIGR02444 family)
VSGSEAAWPPSAFWRFSLAFYADPEVKDACLALQDRHGLDVNLLLLAAWAARSRRLIAAADAYRLRTLSADYQERVMHPVRQARRALTATGAEAWLASLVAQRRRALLAVELDLERLEQLQLERLLDATGSQAATAPPALFLENVRALYPESCDDVAVRRELEPLLARITLPEPQAGATG